MKIFAGKKFCFLVLCFLIISFTFGCSTNKQADQTTADTTAATTAATQQNIQAPTTATEPVNISMFMTNTGWTLPDGTDINSNPWVDYINQKANVKMNITLPSGSVSDSKDKFRILIASADLPDIVFGLVSDVPKPQDGLLVALDDFIKNSEMLSAFHTPDLYDVMRAKDGKIYMIKASRKFDSNPLMWNIRLDLVEECYGKIPSTLDEWFDCLKAVKLKYPDSTPMTSFDGLTYMNQFLESFGVDFVSKDPFKVIDGKVTCVWALPQMKEALEYYKKLYQAGVIDKQFATNKVEDWLNGYLQRQMTIWMGSLYGMNPLNTAYYYSTENKVLFHACAPTVAASGIDPKLTLNSENRLGTYGLGISAKSKNIDAAVKALEVMCSEDYLQFLTYGREGTEYKVENEKKVVNDEESAKTYTIRAVFRFAYDYHTDEARDITVASWGSKFGDNAELKTKYFNSWENDKKLAAQQLTVIGHSPLEFFEKSPSGNALNSKYRPDQISLAVKYITSKISDADYQKEADQLVKDLSPIGEEIQIYYDQNK